MVKEQVSKEVAEKTDKGVKYYTSFIAGLKFVMDAGDTDPSLVKYERFAPYWEMRQGDPVKVGYFKTADKELQKRIDADSAVREISKKEYDEGVAGKKASL